MRKLFREYRNEMWLKTTTTMIVARTLNVTSIPLTIMHAIVRTENCLEKIEYGKRAHPGLLRNSFFLKGLTFAESGGREQKKDVVNELQLNSINSPFLVINYDR